MPFGPTKGPDPRRPPQLYKTIPQRPAPKLPKSPRAQRLLHQLETSAGQIPGITKEILDRLLERLFGESDDALREAQARLHRLVDGKRPLLRFGERIVRRFQAPGLSQRFGREVLLPARMRSLTASEGWNRTNAIVGFDVLRGAAEHAPGWTIGIGVGADVGYLVGLEGGVGFGGMRHQQAFFYRGGAIGVGAYVEVSGGINVTFAPGAPKDFRGLSVGMDLGGAYYAGLSVGAAIVAASLPKLLDPKFGDLTQEDLDSITVTILVGAGVELSLNLEQTIVDFLGGTSETDGEDEKEKEKVKVKAPTNLNGSFHGNLETVSLNWVDNSDNEKGFYVERKPAGSAFGRVATTAANATSYTDEELLEPGPYEYRVQAFKGDTTSEYSNVVTVKVKERKQKSRP
jgi:hypothetical protein